MKVLVLNCGSSSVKYKLFDMQQKSVIAQGGVEKVGLSGAFIKFTLPDGQKVVVEKEIPEHQTAIELILSTLTSKEYGAIESLNEINAVGHRVVHGGEKFNASVVITDEVIDAIKQCSDMAPLHNPANLIGIETMASILPSVPQVAVFDTAFHQTMPAYAFMYGTPFEAYEKYGVRRYGFHGTSHRYVSQRACEFLGITAEGLKMITCHVGNGGSITAVKDGKSVDTSMGFTPLEGLLMGTRSGDIDAGAVTYIMDKEGFDTKGISDYLNKKSGVAGVSGLSSDMRDIEAADKAGDPKAVLAMSMYAYRIKKYIGAYTAALGGVDVIVFTGGVGENQIGLRAQICNELSFMGIELNEQANNTKGEEILITTPESKVKVVVIPTDEEFMIASDTMNLIA